MVLSNTEILSRVKEPKYKNQLLKAVRHEQWLRFHAQEALKREYASRYVQDYDIWVSGLLPSDKAAFFRKMMNFPLYTNELCTSMQDEFNKVFDSQNSSFTYDFTNENYETDFKEYLDDSDFWDKWVEQCKGSMLKRISSVCIVDMPKEPSTDIRPYFYFLDISAVVDLDYHEKERATTIEMIITKQDQDHILVVDERSYRGFKKDGANWIFEFENVHGLDYCPACFYWNESICKDEPIVKKSPITGALNNLDYLLFGETSRRCLESYAAFPVLIAYKETCTYYEEIDHNRYDCRSGYLDTPNGQRACPVCEKNRLIGPGTVFKIKPPQSKEDPNNIDAVKFVGAEVTSLDYWTKRVAELWDEIYYDCVGNSGDAMVQAVNQDQVQGNFESKQNILMKIVGNLEVSTNFVVYTMAKLRYDASFVNSEINFGNRFYLQSPIEAQNEYKAAVDSKVPAYLLSYKRLQVDAANTKGNPVDAQRLKILQELEPCSDYDINTAKLLGMMEIDPKGYLLKLDFSNRIDTFEGTYGSIVEFGSKLPHEVKINKIKEILYSYGAQTIPTPEIKPQP